MCARGLAIVWHFHLCPADVTELTLNLPLHRLFWRVKYPQVGSESIFRKREMKL